MGESSVDVLDIPSKYDEEYYKSDNYSDYLQRRFTQQVKDIISLNILDKDSYILDFGCATGGLINELKKNGYTNVKGTDPSFWAIEYGKKQLGLEYELEYFNVDLLTTKPHLLILLDVLEHCPTDILTSYLNIINNHRPNHIIVRIPISRYEGEDYYLDISRRDKTHMPPHCKTWWLNKFYFMCKRIPLSLPSMYDSIGVMVYLFNL